MIKSLCKPPAHNPESLNRQIIIFDLSIFCFFAKSIRIICCQASPVSLATTCCSRIFCLPNFLLAPLMTLFGTRRNCWPSISRWILRINPTQFLNSFQTYIKLQASFSACCSWASGYILFARPLCKNYSGPCTHRMNSAYQGSSTL